MALAGIDRSKTQLIEKNDELALILSDNSFSSVSRGFSKTDISSKAKGIRNKYFNNALGPNLSFEVLALNG